MRKFCTPICKLLCRLVLFLSFLFRFASFLCFSLVFFRSMSKQFPRLTVTITIYSELHLFIFIFSFFFFSVAVCINCDCQLNVVCGFPRTETANLSCRLSVCVCVSVCVHNKSSLDILNLSSASVAARAAPCHILPEHR